VKKSLIAVFVILGLIVFSIPMAKATSYTIYIDYGNYSYDNGGEFRVKPDANLDWVLNLYSPETKNQGVSGTFQTFCVEHNEYFSPFNTYDVTLNDRAMYGGGGTSGDPLSIGSAWLYHEFQNSGNFDGYATYNYSDPNRSDYAGSSADLLQQALWMLEDEPVTFDSSNIFIKAVIKKFGSLSNAKADQANNEYGVMVMNLYDTTTGARAQDQLVCVPDASIMWLLGPAFIMLGLFGRKKSKEYL
jgi:hypothetical protein